VVDHGIGEGAGRGGLDRHLKRPAGIRKINKQPGATIVLLGLKLDFLNLLLSSLSVINSY